MKKLMSLLVLFLMSFLYQAQQTEIPLLKYEQVEDKIKKSGDKLLVINFWATTCAPCVKELPDFMEVHQNMKQNPNYEMILVSLDRAKDVEKVKKFISEKNITAEVLILDDIKRMNTWIPRYDENWQGEIPVTVFYKSGKKIHFNNGEMSKEDLENTIKQYLN